MKLLREWNKLDCSPDLIRESREKNDGSIILKGVMQRAEAVNQNGRIYPRDILEREVMNYQKLINENRSLGQLDHPDSSIVELQNVSHIVTELYMENNDVFGSVKLLNTPCGQIAQRLVEGGVMLGISSRGVGDTVKDDETGYDRVLESFNLLAFDLVSDPSTSNAFLSEGKNVDSSYIRNFFNRSDRIERIVNELLVKK